MDQTLFETLLQAGDSDGAIRSAAEQRLKELEAAPEYPVSLARLTVSQELAVPQRQLAAVTLKSFVKSNWSARHEENFQGHEPSPECKQAVRELIVHGLADPESKIRVVSAYVVSTIAMDDFPEDWPNLFDILLTYLKSKDANSVHGALRVMLEMVRHTVSVNQLPQIGPLLLPELFNILTNDSVYSFRTRGRAAYIFRKLLHMSSIMRDENKPVVDQLLMPILYDWMQAFHTILNHYVQDDPQKQVEEYGLKSEVIGCIGNVSGLFPKKFAEFMPHLLEPIWTNFRVAKERFIAEAVSEKAYDGDSFQDSDGNEIGMQNWLVHLFEIIESICNKPSLKPLLLANNSALLEELVYHSIGFAQITREQAELWQVDLNQYVADDFEQTGSPSIRFEAATKLSSIADDFMDEFVPVLQRAIQRLLAESNTARANGNTDWFVNQIQFLNSEDSVILSYTDMGLENFKANFDLESLFQHVILEAMGAQDYPFLLGRALIFASGVANLLPTDLANRCLAISVESLQLPNASIPVKVSALHALQKYCKALDKQYLKPYQAAIFEGACSLLHEANEEESLMLILDSINAAFNIDGDAAVQYEATLTNIVLEIWKKYANDHIITSFVLDLFEDFSKSQQYFPALASRALPFIDQVLKTAADSPLVLASAIDLLTAMMKYGPSPLPDPFTEQLFPVVLETGWNSTNNEVVQSTQECVKQYIMKDCDHISRWHDGSGKSGLDYVIHFVAKLLAPNGTEIEPLFIGDLIVILIKKAGNSIASVLPELLNAVLVRLKNTDSQPFIQTLVMVFANLIIHQQENLLQFLFDINIDGQSGLEILMTTWCDNFQNFSGYYSLKVSAIALSKMFLVNDARLVNITVRGNILPNPDGVIVTRSRARQNPERYTAVPIHAKIISLLVEEFASASASEQQANEETESVYDDDGEWDDVTDPAEYALLSDMLNNLDEEDEEENNPDLKDDPIYKTDMKAYLTDFFKNCSAHNVNHFIELCQHHLTDIEKATLTQILGQ